MKQLLNAFLLIVLLVPNSALAATKIYKANLTAPTSKPIIISINGNEVSYEIKNERRGSATFKNLKSIRFYGGKKEVEGSWGLRLTRDGSCYQVKYFLLKNKKLNTSVARACQN